MAAFRNVLGFWRDSFFLGSPHWTPKDMPDLTGKVVIVTGGNAGLGRDTVKALLERNAKVYMACRSIEKAGTAVIDLEKETGNTALVLRLDLADSSSIRQAAEDFATKEERLDILLNNAGITSMAAPDDPVSLSKDGYDLTFTTNVTGHFYLTQLLMPRLLFAAQSPETQQGEVRIVNLSSCGHQLAGPKGIDYDSLREGPARIRSNYKEFYYQSKMGNILVSNELARRFADQNIVSIAVHPGTYATTLGQGFLSENIARKSWLKFTSSLYPIEWGAWTQLWAGTAPEAAAMNVKYVIPWGRPGVPRPETSDEEICSELWAWLEERVKEHEVSHPGQ